MAAGLQFTIGGVWLAFTGLSWYHLFAGPLLLVAGWQLFQHRATALFVFAAAAAGTLAWTVADPGPAPWTVVLRHCVMLVFGAVLLIPRVAVGPAANKPARVTLLLVMLVYAVVTLASIFGDGVAAELSSMSPSPVPITAPPPRTSPDAPS